MPTHFDLIITVDAPSHTAEFRLLDAHGSQLAYRYTDFKTITASSPDWGSTFRTIRCATTPSISAAPMPPAPN